MNQLISNNQLTMSSREIANLVESRHGDVCRSIDRLMQAGAISGYTPTPYTHEQNQQTYFEYFISKRDSFVIVAQLSPAFTARLVDRWLELESQQKPAIPQTYAEALLEAGRLALENERQAEQLAIAAPKVEFFDKFVSASTGSMGFREVAKLLKIKEPEFRLFLSEAKIMYRLGSNYVPYQHHIEAGRFEIKAGVSDSDHAYKQAKFTAKGIEWIASLIAIYRINKELNGG